MNAPQRIVCLTAEAADWLWRLGGWDSVVGVTAYFEPPPDAAPKPRVSGFSSASVENILRLNPDLVIAFSDVQAGIVAQLLTQPGVGLVCGYEEMKRHLHGWMHPVIGPQ